MLHTWPEKGSLGVNQVSSPPKTSQAEETGRPTQPSDLPFDQAGATLAAGN